MPTLPLIAHTLKFIARDFDIQMSTAHWTLGSVGILVGFMGGQRVIAREGELGLLHYPPFLIWYNGVGSYVRAQHYSQSSQPEKIIGIGGQSGPSFLGVHSGLKSEHTGHLAYLIWIMVKTWNTHSLRHQSQAVTAPPSPRYHVTVIDLEDVTHSHNVSTYPANAGGMGMNFAGAGVVVGLNVVACAFAAIIWDWVFFAALLVGIIANGLVRCLLGGRRLALRYAGPESSASHGDGILWARASGDTTAEIILLLGSHDAVHTITHGDFFPLPSRLSLRIRDRLQPTFPDPELVRTELDFASYFLTIQVIAQALLIPMAQGWGQLFFCGLMLLSWVIVDRMPIIPNPDLLQIEILKRLIPQLEPGHNQRFTLRTWSIAIVFALLRLRQKGQLRDPNILLDELEPNNTRVWRMLKSKVLDLLTSDGKPASDYPYTKTDGRPMELTDEEDALYVVPISTY